MYAICRKYASVRRRGGAMGSSQMANRPDEARTMRVRAIVRSLRALKKRRALVCTVSIVTCFRRIIVSMVSQGYPPARAVARPVREHFDRHMAEAIAAGQDGLAVVPREGAIEAI